MPVLDDNRTVAQKRKAARTRNRVARKRALAEAKAKRATRRAGLGGSSGAAPVKPATREFLDTVFPEAARLAQELGRPKGARVIRPEPLHAKTRDAARAAFELRAQEESQGLFPDVWRGIQAIGKVGESAFDAATGIPRLVRDPSWANAGWAAGAVLPLGRVARVGRVALKAKPAVRTFKHGDLVVNIPAAGSRPGRAFENVVDWARPVLSKPHLIRPEERVVGYELGRTTSALRNVRNTEADLLQSLQPRLSAAQAAAVRIVGDEVPIADRLAGHARDLEAALARGDKAAAARLTLQMKLVEKARKYIDESTGIPLLSDKAPKKLRKALALSPMVTEKGEGMAMGLTRPSGAPLLAEVTAEARLSAPGRVFHGAEWLSRESAKEDIRVLAAATRAETRDIAQAAARVQGRAVDVAKGISGRAGSLVGGANFTGRGKFITPYAEGVPGFIPGRARSLPRKILGPGIPDRVLGPKPKLPGQLTHPFTGKTIREGSFTSDVLGETVKRYRGVERLKAVDETVPLLRLASTPTPMKPTDIAIRLGTLTKDDRDEIRRALEVMKAGKAGAKEGAALSTSAYRAILEKYFPNLLTRETAEEVAERIADPQNYGWIDRGLVEASNLLSDPKIVRAQKDGWKRILGQGTFDSFSSLNRVAILYLDPIRYVTVNVAGNVVMNVMQQGPFAIKNLARGAFLSHKMGWLEAATMDVAMGHGASAAAGMYGLKGSASRITAALGKVTDIVPRRAAFLHEAAKQGYKTNAELRELLLNPGARGELDQVLRRARDAIVDFDRLGPIEKDVLTRALFVYPWIKGSARWATRYPLDHPYQAAAAAYIGFLMEGNKKVPGTTYRAGLPDAPAWTRFKTKVPGTDKYVDTGQLFTPSTPIRLGEAVAGFIKGDESAASIIESFNPGVYAGFVAITGFDPFKGYEVGTGPMTFVNTLWGNLAAVSAVRDLLVDPEGFEERQQRSVTPRTRGERIGSALAGGLAPTGFNETRAAALVRKQPKRFSALEKDGQFIRENPEWIHPDYLKYLQDYRESAKVVSERLSKELKLLADREGVTVGGLSGRASGRVEYAIKLAVLKQARPEIVTPEIETAFPLWFEKGTDQEIADYKAWINDMLEYADLLGGKRITSIVDLARKLKKEAARAEDQTG